MKKIPSLVSVIMALGLAQSLFAQVPNEGLANRIIAARQKNAALMKQYSWSCRTEIMEDGSPKDTRVDTVTWGPGGQPQHTEMSDQSNPLPRGFVRRRVVEKEREDTEKYLKDLRGFLHQYTLPTAGGVINFITTATIPPIGPNGVIQMTGMGVVVPGDTLTLTVNASSLQTMRMSVVTSFQNEQVTITATFKTLANGLTYPAYIQISVPDKNMTVLVQNYDYINQNQ